MDFAKIIPMSIVMIAGPQMLSAIFLATSEGWRKNSFAYAFGASLSISIVVTAAYLLGGGGDSDAGSDGYVDYAVLGFLVLAAVHVFMTRKTAEPPKWMGKLQGADAGFSFKLGFLLLGVFPTDILTSFAVGSYLASRNDELWQFLPFLGVTLLLILTPVLLVLAMGQRAHELLPKVRDWMNDNSWVVSEVVICFFIAMVLNDLF